MRTIVLYPDPVLRYKTPVITKVDQALLDDIKDLSEVLCASEDTAAGLAATQLGIKKRFFGLKTDKKSSLKVFLNPRITGVYGQLTYPMMQYEDGKQEHFLEGCLSFPDLFGTVKRYLKIEAAWEEVVDGQLVTKKDILRGFEAIVFQHEAEHLDGILFIDHIKAEGGQIYRWEGDKKKVELKIDDVVKDNVWVGIKK